jgi:two-component sensor histidine kinase
MSQVERTKVLIVDDHPENLLALEGLLADLEIELMTATSGNEALSLMLRHSFAVVLLDAHMPGMDGFETMELMRKSERTRYTPVIFVTEVWKEKQHLFKGYESGAVDYLTKPIEPGIIMSKVKVFVDLHEQRQRAERAVADLEQSQARLSASLREKDVLLREVHHRVKNNLQVVISLLRLQARRISDPDAIAAFTDTQNRIKAMALVHETLYQTTDLSRVSCHTYLQNLIKNLARTLPAGSTNIKLTVELDDDLINIDQAIPMGLVVNELIVNASEHAFPEHRKGRIEVSLGAGDDHELVLAVSDDGVGLPPGIDMKRADILGLRLVRSLAENQLQGSIEIITEGGTCFRITFPRAA